MNGQAYTEFGPDSPGYLGGRWWMDTKGNDEMDVGDHFFLCPLLGPDKPLRNRIKTTSPKLNRLGDRLI